MKPATKEAELAPLAPHVLQILVSVLDRAQHGYAIIKEIAERTGGELELGQRVATPMETAPAHAVRIVDVEVELIVLHRVGGGDW